MRACGIPTELLAQLKEVDAKSGYNGRVSDRRDVEENSESEKPQYGCVTCELRLEQGVPISRAHFSSQAHLINVRRRSRGLRPVNDKYAERTMQVMGVLDEQVNRLSLSDNEDEKSASSDDEDLTLEIIEQRIRELPVVWFLNPQEPSHLYGIYRNLLASSKGSDALNKLNRLQLRQEKMNVAIFMMGGGYFTGAIMSLDQADGLDIVKSKSFHRYTTRRKQGGSQASYDSQKGKANSAGSSLRRYNELALKEEISSLITQWTQDLINVSTIFIAASGNQWDFLIKELGSQIPKEKVFNIPISTGRASLVESTRCIRKLFEVVETTAIETSDHKPAVKPETPSKSSEKKNGSSSSKSYDEKMSQVLLRFARKGKSHQILHTIKKNGMNVNFFLKPSESYEKYPTLLHLAAYYRMPSLVLKLITEFDAEPTLSVNGSKKMAYDVARDSQTRDAFRLARYVMGEEDVDWKQTHVPSPLSPEQVKERRLTEELKQAKIQQDLEKKQIEKTKELLKESSSSTKNSEKPKNESTLKGSNLTRDMNFSNLTPEMKLRIEREQRAKAAEERFRKLKNPKV